VKFKNNSVIPSTALQNAIAGVAVGSPYHEQRFRLILDNNVRPLYDARGRIRASFPQIQVDRARDVKGLAVTVTVDEGESYNLGEVRLEGATSSEQLLKIGNFKSGDLANFDEVKAGQERIRQALRQKGYMKATSTVERTVNDEKKVVDLLIRVEPGHEFRMGKLTIEGLDLHSEPVIRKMWALKTGQGFNVQYPDYFLNRIREDRVFDNLGETKANLKVNDSDHTVDVTLVFRGQGPPKKSPLP
jgi:outer membrane protein insertion porin family